jgi:calcineurin-like phosphoesterase family protein
MAQIWLISDTHFGHANILNFVRNDGTKLRNFSSVEEMDEYMVARWNAVVSPQHHVWHLGDVAMSPKSIEICSRLNGHKRLILGNHDEDNMKYYTPYFKKICSSHRIDTLLLTHIPIHPEGLGKKLTANVHGHVHNNVPALHYGPLYFNVSVEVLDDYAPIALEDLQARIHKQQMEAGAGR